MRYNQSFFHAAAAPAGAAGQKGHPMGWIQKSLLALLVLGLLGSLLAGCNPSDQGTPGEAPEVLSIVVTSFPAYDWVMEILGDRREEAEVTLLLDSGVDLHSYQPTASDLVQLSTCDLFLYVGGESEAWAEDALAEVTNEKRAVISLLEVLGEGVREEELVEGMESQEEEEGPEADEHVWLSLRNASLFCGEIADQLAQLDPAGAETYAANADAYQAQLADLDRQYQQVVDQAQGDTLLFGDRFPFRYLVEDYGLSYYAAFSGCSAESEASFETIAFLADKVDALDLPAVLTLEGDSHPIAETIVATAQKQGVQILSMDSMQTITTQDLEGGASYLDRMTQNLAVLTAALG